MCRGLCSEREAARLGAGLWVSLTLTRTWGSGQEKPPVLPRGLRWLQPHPPLSLSCPMGQGVPS